MSDADATRIESTEPPAMPRSGLGLVSLALILPFISGVLLCFVTSITVWFGVSSAMVIATAALVAIDAARLGKVDLKGRERESAGLLFVGMLALWIVVYPLAFFRRSAFIAPNLGFVALFVAVFFAAAPFVGSMVTPVRLPSCNSKEVVQLLEKIIRSMPAGATAKTIDGYRELKYDHDANVRHGECVAHLNTGNVPIKYVVEWQNRKKGLFQVRLPEPELPSCNGTEVVQLLEKVIRSTPAGTAAKAIDGYRELSYDSDANVRYGECIVHLEASDFPVKFLVEWQDRKMGQFQVRLPGSELPSCSSTEVVQILERAIRRTPARSAAMAIDGYRELSYDRDANVRHGECIAHLETGDVPVKFIVEWQDRTKGLFQVKILASPNR